MLWFRIWFLQCHLLDDELGCAIPAIQNHLQVELVRKISPEDEGMLEVINKWMHMFGHAFNESEISELTQLQNQDSYKFPFLKYLLIVTEKRID